MNGLRHAHRACRFSWICALTLMIQADTGWAATREGCQPPDDAAPAVCLPLPEEAPCEGERCFYISPCHGDDRSGDGSLRRPWKSFRWLTRARAESRQKAIELRAGDVVYLLDGVLEESWSVKDPALRNEPHAFLAYGIHGSADQPITIKALAGRTIVVDPGRKGYGLRLWQTSHVVLQGFEVRNACGRGISIERSQDIMLRDIVVSDTDGLDNDGVAGVHVRASRDVRIEGGQFFDNFDRDAADTGGEGTESSGNVVFFGGQNASVRYAHFFNTLGNDLAGFCLKYAQAASEPAATFEVVGNRFDNCSFYAVSTSTQNTLVSDNLIVGGAGLASRDNGGLTHQTNQRFVHNTIYLDGPGLIIEMTDAYRTLVFPDEPRGLEFSNNIVVDLRPFYLPGEGILEIGAFATLRRLEAARGALRLTSNCYSNVRTPVRFTFIASPSGSQRVGYDIFDWKALGYDEGSVLANPTFVDVERSDFRLAAASACQGLGARIFRGVE